MKTDPRDAPDIQNAYLDIHRFFDTFSLPAAVRLMEGIFTAACDSNPWEKQAPYNVVFFLQRLEQLSNAAATLHYERSYRQVVILDWADDRPNDRHEQTQLFARHPAAAWVCFPRHLSQTQYDNPYKAIKKYVNHLSAYEWKEKMKDLLEYALSYGSVEAVMSSYELLKIRQHTLALIEACHLIDVRCEITEDNAVDAD